MFVAAYSLVSFVLDNSGEERPLVREVVIHQRARHPGTLGDLIDADLVIGSLPEHFCSQCQQLSTPILGR